MRITVFALPASLIAVMLGTLAACSAAPPIPDDLVSEQSSTAGKKPAAKKDGGALTPAPTPDPTTPSPSDSDGGPAPAPGACGASVNQDACFTCCETANPKALPILDQAWGDCVCQSPGACKTACAATFCNGVNPTAGDACDTCLATNDQACSQQAETACLASADCKPLFTCDDDAKCAAKPQ